MFVALPRKVDAMLPRANLACVEPYLNDSLSCGKGISLYCALSVETVLCRSGVCIAAKWRIKSVLLSYSFINLNRYCGIQKVLITMTKVYARTHRSTATRGCRASILDMNTVNKRTSLPRTNSCARQSHTIDTQPKIRSAARLKMGRVNV
jgi:hypothetical protein